MTYIETLKLNINQIPLVADQFIYCIDNKECFYDVSTTERIGTGKIDVVNKEDKKSTTPVNGNLCYVKETNRIYKYNNGWVIQSNNLATLFNDNNDLKTLVPVTLKHNGIKVAPRTFVNCIFTPDGTNLQDILDDLDRCTTKYTTVNVTANTNNQSIFTIPYPITPYDLYRNALAISYNNTVIDPSTYIFSSDFSKITLPIDIPLGGIITFIFIYADSKRDLNAYSVNNIRVFLKKPPAPRLYDIVFSLFTRDIQQYDGSVWRSIGSAQYGLKLKSHSENITTTTTSVNIGIDFFNKDTDSLIVIKNSTVLVENADYSISDDNKTINYFPVNSGSWQGTPDNPEFFSFLCFKNVPLYDGYINGNEILEDSIQETSLAEGVRDKLNRTFINQSQLDKAISDVLGSVPSTLNTLEKLATAINDDPLYVKNQFATIANSLNTIIDKISNKVIIKVQTIDLKPVAGQTITVVNNKTNVRDTYQLYDTTTMTVVLDKLTSYTLSMDLKTGYLTPDPVTFNSGHLGDITNIGFTYHL